MYKRDFSAAEFATRQARVRAAMAARKLDLLVVIHPANINWLIGARHKSYQQFQCLFIGADASDGLVMLTRLAEQWELQAESLASEVRGWGGREPENPIDAFAAIVREKSWQGRRIGLEVPRYYIGVEEHGAIRAFLGSAIKADATRLVEELKFVKSPAELRYIGKAVGFADAAMAAFVKAAKPGRTEHQLAGEVYRTMLSAGGDVPASPINIGFGPRSAYGHPLPSERKLRRGDFGQVEYGAAFRRYCTTLGRQVVVGKPNRKQSDLYKVVRESCDAAIAAIRPGVRADVPHEAAKRVIVKAGLEHGRWHLTGYGIAPGFAPVWGESLEMDGGSRDVIAAGMVLSIEPPVFLPKEKLGCRIIDNVLVTAKGCRVLSTYTRDLIVL